MLVREPNFCLAGMTGPERGVEHPPYLEASRAEEPALEKDEVTRPSTHLDECVNWPATHLFSGCAID